MHGSKVLMNTFCIQIFGLGEFQGQACSLILMVEELNILHLTKRHLGSKNVWF